MVSLSLRQVSEEGGGRCKCGRGLTGPVCDACFTELNIWVGALTKVVIKKMEEEKGRRESMRYWRYARWFRDAAERDAVRVQRHGEVVAFELSQGFMPKRESEALTQSETAAETRPGDELEGKGLPAGMEGIEADTPLRDPTPQREIEMRSCLPVAESMDLEVTSEQTDSQFPQTQLSYQEPTTAESELDRKEVSNAQLLHFKLPPAAESQAGESEPVGSVTLRRTPAQRRKPRKPRAPEVGRSSPTVQSTQLTATSEQDAHPSQIAADPQVNERASNSSQPQLTRRPAMRRKGRGQLEIDSEQTDPTRSQTRPLPSMAAEALTTTDRSDIDTVLSAIRTNFLAQPPAAAEAQAGKKPLEPRVLEMIPRSPIVPRLELQGEPDLSQGSLYHHNFYALWDQFLASGYVGLDGVLVPDPDKKKAFWRGKLKASGKKALEKVRDLVGLGEE